MYVLRTCLNFFFGGESILFYLICIVYLCFYIFTYIWVGRESSFLTRVFLNFILKLVMLLLYLNSCKIYLFKVVVLHCVILF